MTEDRKKINSDAESGLLYDDAKANPNEDANLGPWEVFKEEIVHLKWRVLVLCCCLTYGSYYIYDFPGAIGTGKTNSIEAKFIANGKPYTPDMNQLLYSVYSWPNTVLAFFGGLLIDNYLGLRKSILLFSSLVLGGSIVFYFGTLGVNFPAMVVGRVLFGLGGESLSVAQSAFVARWFKGGRGMALAFGITISFARVGSSFNFLFSPMIANKAGIDMSVLVGTFGCAFSLLTAILVVIIDLYGVKKGLVPPESKETNAPFNFRDLKRLSLKFWLTCLICVTVYCSIFPLVGIAEPYFVVKYDVSDDTASQFVSVFQFTCAGGSPVVGFLVDMVGRFTYGMVLASSLFTALHTLLVTTLTPAIVLMMLLGFTYSLLVSVLWPAVPYVVRSGEVGLAYGIMTAMQNTGLAIWPLLTGAILTPYTPDPPQKGSPCYNFIHNDTNVSHYHDGVLIGCSNTTNAPLPTHEGFVYTEILFIATAGTGILFAIWLLALDLKGTGLLSAKPSKREILEKDRLAAYAAEDKERLKLIEEDKNATAY